MKKIEMIIKPFKLDALKDALNEIGSQGMTTSARSKDSAARKATPKSIAGQNI